MGEFELHNRPAFVPLADRRYACQQHYRGVFGIRQCERIVRIGEGLPRSEGEVSSGFSEGSDQLTRRAGISWMDPGPDHYWIFEKLARVVARANRYYQFDLTGFTEDAQFTRYEDKGAFYDWHQDGLEGELSMRKLSLVVQLTDPDEYEGGDLEFFSLSSDPELGAAWRDDLRLQGSVSVFPSFEHHRVTPMVRGSRHSLVCWVGGPPFR